MRSLFSKYLATIALSLSVFSSAQAIETGEPIYSAFVVLKCATPSTCGDLSVGPHKMTVYRNVVIDVPPRIENRLYWNQNKPSGKALGYRYAETIGASCGDGTNMTATWSFSSNTPTYATAIDCDGNAHGYFVSEIF